MKKEYTTHQVERLEFDYVKAAVPSACIMQQISVVYAGEPGCDREKSTTCGDE